jgi:two-component system response regulator YesN
LLKQELSQTFVEILTDIRMKKALSLMWNGNYTVKEISEKVGYSNITYFYKVFKKYTGMNIGEMREYLN